MLTNMKITDLRITGGITAAASAVYPIGTVANLYEPYKGVTKFRRTSNGKWTSYPGNEWYFETFAQLNLAAPVASVDLPAETLPPVTGPASPASTDKGVTGDVGPVPDAIENSQDKRTTAETIGLVALAIAHPIATGALALAVGWFGYKLFKK